MANEQPRKLLVFGAGGHAKSVIAAIDAGSEQEVAAILTEVEAEAGSSLLGHPVVHRAAGVAWARSAGVSHAIVAIGDNRVRARIGQSLAAEGFTLATVIHPLAWVAPAATIGPGSFVHVFAVVGPASSIGPGSIISAHAVVGHDTMVGAWAHLTPGTRIGGGATIGEGAFLGMGCTVLPRVKIGAHASVGANSVVHKDIPEGAIVAGNPARMIKSG